MQKVLHLFTNNINLREKLESWNDAEDPALFLDKLLECQSRGQEFFVGFVRSQKTPSYTCILDALSDGWKLLGPPFAVNHDTEYCWFLVKD